MDGKPRLLDQMRNRIRVKHYAIRTEQVYCDWVKQFIRFHRYRHPAEMGAAEVEAFPTDLAVRRKVSASTQNQALAAVLDEPNVAPPTAWLVSSLFRLPAICFSPAFRAR